MHKLRAKEVLKRLNGTKPTVCEIGVFAGRMSRAMLEARPDMELFLIDPWTANFPESYKATGDFHSKLSQQEQDRFYRLTLDAVQGFNANIVRQFSADAAKEFEDEFFDLIFIDGDHSYEGCLADIENYVLKVKKGGYLGGHDYANKSDKWEFGVTQAVDEFIEKSGLTLELGENFTWFVRL